MNKLCKHLLVFSYAVLALSCSQETASTGQATLSGKIVGSVPSGQTSVMVAFPIPVFNETVEYETLLKEDGSFSISVPVFFPTYAQMVVGSKEYAGTLLLSPDKDTKIEVSFNESAEIQVKIIEGNGSTPDEMAKLNEVFMNGYQSYLKTFADVEANLQSDTLPEDYRKSILKLRETYLSNIEGMDNLPKNLRTLVYNSLPSGGSLLFDYGDRKPNLSYFSFLRLLDLNNPPLNSHIVYPTISKSILSNKVLNIPRLEDKSVEDWLNEVKPIMSDLLGFDIGLFYDVLTFHAFF
ncbi:hypothetical protein AGMMS49982_01930 [Bacteroidia bacterium]|nr:hypothetical protein AGMMS49982_01930 [Bacteroidia bacterium]